MDISPGQAQRSPGLASSYESESRRDVAKSLPGARFSTTNNQHGKLLLFLGDDFIRPLSAKKGLSLRKLLIGKTG